MEILVIKVKVKKVLKLYHNKIIIIIINIYKIKNKINNIINKMIIKIFNKMIVK